MQLAQQKRQLLGIKSNMEREYGRIAARYLKIFTNINKELETRIRQIDQPVFELVNKHMATSSNRMYSLTSWVAISQNEGLTKSQQIIVSKIKNNAQVALEQSTDFLSQIGEQRVLTNKVLISNPSGNDNRNYKLPVVIYETVNDKVGIPRKDVSMPDFLSSNYSNQINNTIRESNDLPWEESEKSRLLSEEFDRIVEDSNDSSRVKQLIRKMYTSSNFETL